MPSSFTEVIHEPRGLPVVLNPEEVIRRLGWQPYSPDRAFLRGP